VPVWSGFCALSSFSAEGLDDRLTALVWVKKMSAFVGSAAGEAPLVSAAYTRAAQQLRPTLQLGVRRLLGRKSPFQVTFSLTNRCNFLCKYCRIPTQHLDEMPTAEWFEVIDEFRAGGMGRASLIGGEPLVREDAGEIIRHLNAVGVHAAMNTNGWSVAERIDEVSRLDLVCITLDGPEEVHDRQRRTGSYRRVIDGIQRLRSRDRQVVTMTVVTRTGADHVRHVLEVAKEMGTRAYFQLVHNENVDVNAPIAPDISTERVEALMDELKGLKAQGWPVGNSFAILEQQKRNRYIGTCADCYAGRYYAYVFSDGTVAPCLLTQHQVRARNGKARGYLRAFQEMEAPVGPGCSCSATHEVNLILDFDVRTLFEALSVALRPARQ
jgi:MoaA/NifB/PqqE/SkfB family radical SAM enzyme